MRFFGCKKTQSVAVETVVVPAPPRGPVQIYTFYGDWEGTLFTAISAEGVVVATNYYSEIKVSMGLHLLKEEVKVINSFDNYDDELISQLLQAVKDLEESWSIRRTLGGTPREVEAVKIYEELCSRAEKAWDALVAPALAPIKQRQEEEAATKAATQAERAVEIDKERVAAEQKLDELLNK